MKLERLEAIIMDMREDRAHVFSFEYTNGRTLSILLFDIEQIIITFIKFGTNEHFDIEVNEKYEINTYLGENLSKLKKMLGIKYSSDNKFSTNKFFEDFANSLPDYNRTGRRETYECAQYLSKYIEDADRTAYIGIINWNIEGPGHVRPDNLNKTLTYLGHDLYERFKDNNISSKWTSFEELNNNPKYENYRNHEANVRQMRP